MGRFFDAKSLNITFDAQNDAQKSGDSSRAQEQETSPSHGILSLSQYETALQEGSFGIHTGQ